MADEQKYSLANNEVWELMNGTTAAKVATKSKVLVVQPHNSAHFVLHALASRKVVGCPVLNDTDAKEPIAFIQATDILGYAVDTMGDVDKITPEQLTKYPWDSTTLKDILAKVDAEPVTLNYDGTSLSHFVEVFAAGVHRTSLYTQRSDAPDMQDWDHEKMTAIISQTDVVRFLAAHLKDEKIKYIAGLPITRMGFKTMEVKTIKASESMLAAIKALKSSAVSSLVVLSNDGKVIGNVTHRAFRGFTSDNYKDLLLPIEEFLKRYAPDALKTFHIEASVTFGDLVNNFATKHLHHQYILKADGTLDGVVSLTDVMRWILSFRMTDEEKEAAAKAPEEKFVVPVPVTLTIRVNELSGLPRGITGSHNVYLLMKFPGGRTVKTNAIASKTEASQIKVDFSSIDPEQFVVQEQHKNSKIIIEAFSQGRFLGDTFLGRHFISMRYVLNGLGTGSADTKQSVDGENLVAGSSTAELKFELYLTPVKA